MLDECALRRRFEGPHFISKCDTNKSSDCPDCQAAKAREESAVKVREDFRKGVEKEAAKAREEEMARIKEAAAIFLSVTSALEAGPSFTQSKCIFECHYEKPTVKTPAVRMTPKVPHDFAQTKTEEIPIAGLLRVNMVGAQMIPLACA